MKYSEMISLFEKLGDDDRKKMVDGMNIEELTIFCDGFLKYKDNYYHGDGWVIYMKTKMRDDKFKELGID